MLIALLIAAIAIAFLLLIIWSQRRIREPRLHIESDAALGDLVPSLAGLSHGHLVGGNAVEVLENGAFFDVLLADIEGAKVSVHFETYLWEDGELGGRVGAALAAAAERGAEVRVLVDAYGGKGIGARTEHLLESAGCRLCFYRAGRLRNIGLQNSRDHRKLVVIDGRIAFVGGHCVKDTWLGNAEDKSRFRDVSVRLRGPIVHSAQATFSENWVEETGELFVGERVFPHLEPAGTVEAHCARVRPAGSAPPAVRILYHLAVCLARRRIYIQNPYFLPGPIAVQALAGAVARGVDVRVMVPAAEVSDMPMVQHAAHRNFGKLLRAGVRVLEYQRTLLHQKIITVDGAWCVIGSANFDERSLAINDEVTVGFRDEGLARHLEDIFLRDAVECVELDARAWAARGFMHRCKDHALYVLKYQL